MIYAAVMGYGTIGSGVAEGLEKNRGVITARTKEEIQGKYILDLREFPGDPNEDKVIHDFSVIEQDEDVKIVVETMGGVRPAYDFVKASLLAGKHVVTSNKSLVAACGTELLQIARDKGLNFLFEASVGGGIPLIRPLTGALAGEKIVEISGILNGTTNYILTKMAKEGQTFEEALRKAQELGYAERNPESDVEGYDTCRKISILTALATGREVNYEDVYTEGITAVTDTDFRYAAALGTCVKLFGSSRMEDGRVSVFVCPMMIPQENPLSSVSDVFNAVMVKGNMAGTLMFYGSGAGKLPTASAVVGDMIAAVQLKDRPAALGWTGQRLEVLPVRQLPWKYFARFKGSREEKKTLTEELFGKVRWLELAGLDEVAILTGPMTGEEFDRAAGQLGGLRRAIRAQV